MVLGERGEVKHLSTRRKRYSVSSGERKRMMAKPGVRCSSARVCVCSVLWGKTSSLQARCLVTVLVFVCLNNLGWLTKDRDSRVEQVKMGVDGFVPE